MKYYVRTTGERDLSQYSFLDCTPLYDFEHRPVPSFIEQMKLISEDDAVFMEDDIIFCADFENRLNQVIAACPNMIINFYYQPLAYYRTDIVPGAKFLYNQCVYYPKGIARQIAEEMENILSNGACFKQYDELQAKAMHNLGIDFLNFRPCLVQHIGKDSLLGNKWINAAGSPYFITILEEKNLDYKDVKTMIDHGLETYKELGIEFTPPKIIPKGE